MRPDRLLPLLLGGAMGAAGILQGLQWRNAAQVSDQEELSGRLVALENEVALLKRENESLRSLAQGGGEVAVDAELVAYVEKALGLNFKSTPQVHRIAGEELRERIVAAIEARYGPHGMDSRQQAWVLMGFLTAEDRFAGQLAAMKAIGARSWFDDQSGEAWVTDRFDSESIPDQAALIRALVRVLIHQHNPPAPGWPGDEAALAREALHQGAALAVENRFLARQALGIGFTGAQENTEARELLANLPAFVRGIATFPSLLGVPRAERLFDQEEILSGLHRPPQSTADFFPGHEEMEAVTPELPQTPGNTLLEESAGMLGVRLWLEPLGGELAKLADSWRGDRYRLHATDDLSVHLIWDVRLDGKATADEFQKAAADLVSAIAGTESPLAPGETVLSQDGRKLRVERPADDVVRLVNESA